MLIFAFSLGKVATLISQYISKQGFLTPAFFELSNTSLTKEEFWDVSLISLCYTYTWQQFKISRKSQHRNNQADDLIYFVGHKEKTEVISICL